jgi:predicted amidophosphoribosyltransferase
MFGEFKVGEDGYVYPLALGIFASLTQHDLLEYDAVVPIPLSPDKQAAGELHRTRALAREVARLLGRVPVREYLSLTEPVSKRRMLSARYSKSQFRQKYYRTLNVDSSIRGVTNILLIDDVITEGLTVSCAVRRLREANPELDIVIASAGQMIIKRAVVDEADFIAAN